jgi:acetyltransferase-like isoleucine patch superfamily enzyme
MSIETGRNPTPDAPTGPPAEDAVVRTATMDHLSEGGRSALEKYADFFVGESSLAALLKYELFTVIGSSLPGALGYLARKVLYKSLIGECGPGVQFGRNVTLRHPTKMRIGQGTAVDDDCLLDARGTTAGRFVIGARVLIARACLIQSKSDAGTVEIGDECSIGGQSTLTSSGGVRLGRHVLVAGQCYIGGGRYRTEDRSVPMIKQGMYSRGPVVIGDDVWLGAGARVLDGVEVGSGAVIGAGSVVTKSVPSAAIAVGIPARVVGSR